MSIVFDEVTATIETPENPKPAAENLESGQAIENPAERLMQLLEARARRLKRLWAD